MRRRVVRRRFRSAHVYWYYEDGTCHEAPVMVTKAFVRCMRRRHKRHRRERQMAKVAWGRVERSKRFLERTTIFEDPAAMQMVVSIFREAEERMTDRG